MDRLALERDNDGVLIVPSAGELHLPTEMLEVAEEIASGADSPGLSATVLARLVCAVLSLERARGRDATPSERLKDYAGPWIWSGVRGDSLSLRAGG